MGYVKYCLTQTCENRAGYQSSYCHACQIGNPPESLPVPPYLGRQIREALEPKWPLNQADVAKRVGVDSSIIHLWLRDKRPVPWNRIGALAEALETTEDALLGNYPRPTVIPPLRVVAGGSEDAEPAFVPMFEEPEEEVVDLELPEPPPSAVTRWLWCEADHGSGVPRRHHHGIAPFWRLGPPERIDAA
jgi:transcriptional regulator with XRE-family HTH domain